MKRLRKNLRCTKRIFIGKICVFLRMDATQKIHVSECDKNRYKVKSSWVKDGCP